MLKFSKCNELITKFIRGKREDKMWKKTATGLVCSYPLAPVASVGRGDFPPIEISRSPPSLSRPRSWLHSCRRRPPRRALRRRRASTRYAPAPFAALPFLSRCAKPSTPNPTVSNLYPDLAQLRAHLPTNFDHSPPCCAGSRACYDLSCPSAMV